MRQRYYGFLSDTDLVLCTLCYSDRYDIIFSNRYFSRQPLGEGCDVCRTGPAVVGRDAAGGATAICMPTRTCYVDGGEAWEEAVFRVIEYKTRRAAVGQAAAPIAGLPGEMERGGSGRAGLE